MRATLGFWLTLAAAVSLPLHAASAAHGGHGGGGGGGGFGGGATHSGGMHTGGISGGGSFRGPSISSGGNVPAARSFSSGGGRAISGGSGISSSGGANAIGSYSGSAIGAGSNRATFMKNNFPNQSLKGYHQSINTPATTGGTRQYQVNRTGSLSSGSLNQGNSFIRSQNINSTDAKHWTHNNGNWNKTFVNSPAHINRQPNGGARNHPGGNGNQGNWANGNNGNWNYWNRRGGSGIYVWPWFGFGSAGLWGGWGWPYYGWGYGYGYPLYASNLYGYGYGYPYYANNYATTYTAAQPAQAQPDQLAAADFADQGEADFKAARYEAAARDWQHALVDDPQNGGLVMLLGQALFAMGKYDEAAGATQAAMQMLPEDKWGVVISNYSQLYGNIQDYTDELKALEAARDKQPDSPALHFLLGFHFGYLGYPKHAVRELDKGLNLAPADMGAQKVRAIFAAKWPEAPPLPAAAVEAAKEFEKQQSAQPPAGGPAPPGAQPPAAQPPARPGPSDDGLGTPS